MPQAQSITWNVIREHDGDRPYKVGETRQGTVADLGHLEGTSLERAEPAAMEQPAGKSEGASAHNKSEGASEKDKAEDEAKEADEDEDETDEPGKPGKTTRRRSPR